MSRSGREIACEGKERKEVTAAASALPSVELTLMSAVFSVRDRAF